HDKLKAELWRVYKLGEKPRRTWQEAALRWLDEKEHKADLKHDIEKLRWLDSYFGQLYLDEISRDLIDEVASEKKKGKAAATANRYLALIRSILRAARDDWEWVQQIPRVRLFKEPEKRVRWITRDEATALLRELPDHLADMAAFTLATGLRRNNVTQLRWDQVDLSRAVAWIHPDQSKSRKAISVPLNRDALSILKRRQRMHAEYAFTYQDRPVLQTSTKAWYAALKRAGISNFRWHDLRHTWASWHVQNGTSLQELMELGGWASYTMVLRYAHLATGQLKSAAERIEGSTYILHDE
ncbi:MAG: site-specific integrase, partial [Pseudomonadota bacterium]